MKFCYKVTSVEDFFSFLAESTFSSYAEFQKKLIIWNNLGAGNTVYTEVINIDPIIEDATTNLEGADASIFKLTHND